MLTSLFRKAVFRFFALFGYEVRRSSGSPVSFANFENLAQAYEQRLSEANIPIAANETRARLLARLYGTPPSEAYFIVEALVRCKDVVGDVCEFGVAQGETSALVANEIKGSKKVLHLFDSFQGLPEPTEKDELKDDIFSLGDIHAYAGTMSYPEDMVRARLRAVSFPTRRVVIHKGFIERVLEEDSRLPAKVSFAYLDFDFYRPTRLALDYLHSVTSTGAILVIDDYDFFSTGVKAAVDEFLEEKRSTAESYECLVPNPRYGYFAVLTRRG